MSTILEDVTSLRAGMTTKEFTINFPETTAQYITYLETREAVIEAALREILREAPSLQYAQGIAREALYPKETK